jgi:hypothetical protein
MTKPFAIAIACLATLAAPAAQAGVGLDDPLSKAITANTFVEGVPKGWMATGSAPQQFSFGTDLPASAQGRKSARISSKPSTASGDFGTLMQILSAETYRGKRVRLAAMLRAQDVSGWAGLWCRVDGPDGKILAFDNMQSRAVTGTADWKRYEVVLDVSAQSLDVAFGFLLAGKGTVWADAMKLDIVGNDVPTTDSYPVKYPKAPVNLNFESALKNEVLDLALAQDAR